jgi:hypothetical protein
MKRKWRIVYRRHNKTSRNHFLATYIFGPYSMLLLSIRTCARPGIPTSDARVPSRAISTGDSQHRRMAFAAYREEFLCHFVPRYVPSTVIRRDLQTPTVTEEIRRYSSQYSARLSAHPNDLIVNLIELPDSRRLRRHLPNDLPTGFLVKYL